MRRAVRRLHRRRVRPRSPGGGRRERGRSYLSGRRFQLLALFLAACADNSQHAGTTTVARDSAGVRIVETTAAALARAATWRVGLVPSLDIGGAAGQPAYEFYRINGVRSLGNGDFIVNNSGTRELRVFDEQGEFRYAFGGSGEGPGELNYPMGPWISRSDTLVVWDMRLRRLSIFHDGAFVRGANMKAQIWNPMAVGFTQGKLIIAEHRLDATVDGRGTDHINMMRFSLDAEVIDTIGHYAWFDRVAHGNLFETPIFEQGTIYALSPNGYWVGLNRSYEVSKYLPDGELIQILRWPGADRAVAAADLVLYREAELAKITTEEQRRRMMAQLARPALEQFPAYEFLIADLQDNLWVRQYDRPGYKGAQRWLVFDELGRVSGRLQLPQGFRPWEIGADYLVGTFADEFDVEHVQRYDLIKPNHTDSMPAR